MAVEKKSGLEVIIGKVKKKAVNAALNAAIKVGAMDWFIGEVYSRLPRLIRIKEFSPEFTNKFLDLTRDNQVPEIVEGHFDHLDHIVGSHFCTKLIDLSKQAGQGKELNGFMETLATSVVGGQQSIFLARAFPKMAGYAKIRGLTLVPVTRTVDVERYDMNKSMGELRTLVESTRQEKVGVIVPAGGSVEPGRHPKGCSGDNINGLQEIKDNYILTTYRAMEISGKCLDPHQRPYILGLAINRSYRILSSDSLLPTPEGMISLYDRLSDTLALFGFERMIVDISPTMPIAEEDLVNNLGSNWRRNTPEVNQFVMIQIAKELPENARGYYGKFVS